MREKRHWRKTSEAQREQIKMFSIAGMTLTGICKEVGVHRQTVCAIQKSLGLTKRNPEPEPVEVEKEILKLRREGYGSPRISKKLNVPLHRVLIVLQAHTLIAPPGTAGCQYSVPVMTQRAIRREFRSFEKRIAKKYGLSLVWTQRFLRRRKT
jgi:transposase-like protein